MFDRYLAQKSRSRRPWRMIALVASLAGHAGVAVALLVVAVWQLDRLTPQERRVLMVSAGGPPPMAASKPPPALERLAEPRRKAARKRVDPRQLRQPATSTREESVELETFGGGSVGETWTSGGDPSGTAGIGTGIGPGEMRLPEVDLQPPPEPPTMPAKSNIPARFLDGKRVAGNDRIAPPETVRLAMLRDGRQELRGVVKMCLDRDGRVSGLELVASTGYRDYDDRLLVEMTGWLYQPYQANGEPIPVCAPITFLYKMRE